MAGVFVTGTGTDVGKTFVTAALVRHLRSAGKPVDAFKPVVSGFDPANIASSDPGVLLSALGRGVISDELDRIAPWRFAAPLSPDLAAKAERRSMDFSALVEFSRRVAYGRGTTLVEGIGGNPDYVDPVQQWTPEEASPSGIAIVGGTVFIANLRGETLRAVPVADPSTSVEYFSGTHGRLRHVTEAPDGALWFLTSNTDGYGSGPRDGDDHIVSVRLTN